MSRCFLFVDESNLYLAAKKKGWSIDWELFLEYVTLNFSVTDAYLYEGMPTQRSLGGRPREEIAGIITWKRHYFDWLRSVGYVVRHKPVSCINGDNKCNFDVEIAIDAVDQCANFDACVLASGDGDFIRLVRYLRGKGKHIHIIGPKRTNKELKKEARGNFTSLDGIRSHVQKN